MFQNANSSTKNSNTKSARQERLCLWDPPRQPSHKQATLSIFPKDFLDKKKTGKGVEDTISWTNTPTGEERRTFG